MWKVVAIAVTAITVGAVHTFIKPHLDAVIPSNLKSNWVTQSFFTGAFIIVALVISTTALRAIGAPTRKVA